MSWNAVIGYARMQAERLGIQNVRFAEADILTLGGLDQRFDHIEAMGVLHHLAEPLTGWNVLRGLLVSASTAAGVVAPSRPHRLWLTASRMMPMGCGHCGWQVFQVDGDGTGFKNSRTTASRSSSETKSVLRRATATASCAGVNVV